MAAKKIDINDINTSKASSGIKRPFFGNIEITMFEKLYKKIMKFNCTIVFDYDRNSFSATTDNADAAAPIRQLFRMVEEAKRLGQLYTDMYSEDPKYFASFSHFKNNELDEWMKPRLAHLNDINDHYHFAIDPNTKALSLYIGTRKEEYSVKHTTINFFNEEKTDSEEDICESSTTFIIDENLNLRTITNVERMADTLYRTAYALNPYNRKNGKDALIKDAKVTINMKDPTANRIVISLK